jgi:enoyl-CoA hydratase/carnithine racemase
MTGALTSAAPDISARTRARPSLERHRVRTVNHARLARKALTAIGAAANSTLLQLAPPPRTRDNRCMPQTQAKLEKPLLARYDADGIAILTLDRPAQRNALSTAMLAALQNELASIGPDNSLRAVIIAANGTVFSAGHDLKELTAARAAPDKGRAFFEETMAQCGRVMQTIVQLPQPVIAAIEGVATAAGCQLVATCDLAVAGEDAQFCTPGVDIGLFCSTPMVALSRNLSSKHALEMLLLGEMIEAHEAHRLGLVNRVVARGSVLMEAERLARKIAEKSTYTVKIGKRAFYEQREMGLAAAYAHMGAVMVENLLARDGEEGIAAFLGKRKPQWS